jgi:glycerophosphoryl diester phosphodiesterase
MAGDPDPSNAIDEPHDAPAQNLDHSPDQRPSRRTVLGALGLGTVGGLVAGAAAGAGIAARGSAATGTATGTAMGAADNLPSTQRVTVESWRATRGQHYFIAHRGSGDVYPEHSLDAYRAALGAGAQCLEISVVATSDGQLICQHDLTYDRTTTATGRAAAQPSTILRSVALRAPQLGPAWGENPLPRIALLADALDLVRNRAVVCLEAKDDNAYPATIAMTERLGMRDSVIIKAFHASRRIAEAKKAGYPVFAYFGVPTDITAPNVASLASLLHPDSDYLVIPAYDSTTPDGYLAAEALRRCLGTRIPVWVYPVHRRADAAHFFSQGVAGVVTSSYPYVTSSAPSATADSWKYRAIAPGEMSRDPASATWAPTWQDPDQLALAAPGGQHFLTLGQLSPIGAAQGSYSIAFDAAFQTVPSDSSANITLAFGHTDDRYYEHQLGASTGYHAIQRADGRLELFAHVAGHTAGVPLGTARQLTAPRPGEWMSFRLDVTPTTLAWSSNVGGSWTTISATDRRIRGGYVHIGRSSRDGTAAFRYLTITEA